MTTSVRIPVNPLVLVWARQTARLSLSEAAERVGVSEERLARWESGDIEPTINQLRKAAQVYYRPLASLFVADVPDDSGSPQLPDFRRTHASQQQNSKALDDALMRARSQRDTLVSIGEESGETPADMGAKFALDRSQDSELLGAELHNALTGAGVIWSNRQSETFLRLLVAGAERLGVVVIQTQRVDLAAMRGFSLADGPCPIIALNGSDAPRGKTFTLLHELAHVGFRADGLCDLAHDVVSDIERLCDRVAAAALMPKQEFLMAASSLRGGSLIVENVGALGDSFGVSGEAALIRLIELGHASWTDYHRLKPEFEAKYRAYRERMQHEQQEKSAKIGFSLKVRDLGRSYIRAVLRAHGDDLISSGEVTSLLGTGYGELAKFAQAAGGDTW